MYQFATHLLNTGVVVSFVEFGRHATSQILPTLISNESIGDIMDYIYNVYDPMGDVYSNWDDSFRETSNLITVHDLSDPLIVFVSYTDPTAYSLNKLGEPGSWAVELTGIATDESLLRAVEGADIFKALGAKIFATSVDIDILNVDCSKYRVQL